VQTHPASRQQRRCPVCILVEYLSFCCTKNGPIDVHVRSQKPEVIIRHFALLPDKDCPQPQRQNKKFRVLMMPHPKSATPWVNNGLAATLLHACFREEPYADPRYLKCRECGCSQSHKIEVLGTFSNKSLPRSTVEQRALLTVCQIHATLYAGNTLATAFAKLSSFTSRRLE
jgi:hypothetical protein